MTSGSPKWSRSLARTLLIEGCVVSSSSAARVRLRSRSRTLKVLRSFRRTSPASPIGMSVIPVLALARSGRSASVASTQAPAHVAADPRIRARHIRGSPDGRTSMSKFIIESHFRLQEWVAEERGYFRLEGLDYEFRELIRSTDGAHHQTTGKSGAFQSIEKGRASNITCACHWTVNVAASKGHTKLYADAYSVAPAGIFVR